MSFSYRSQNFLSPHDLITEARFKVQASHRGEIQERIQTMLNTRKAAQPIDKPSCGSVFKNPDPENNIHAWKVIADCGFRGKSRGGAQVSEMHTNFIINNGGAKASDVRALIADIQQEAQNRFGIKLEEEVKIIPYNGICFVD
jgi:UDP-N-acetylmuramate dehydrogenase